MDDLVDNAYNSLMSGLGDSPCGRADLQIKGIVFISVLAQHADASGWNDAARLAVGSAAFEAGAWVHRLSRLSADDAGRPRLVALARTAAERAVVLAEMADYLSPPRAGTPARTRV